MSELLLNDLASWVHEHTEDDGSVTLMIAEHHRSDVRVQSYTNRVRQTKKVNDIQFLPLDQIKAYKEQQPQQQTDKTLFSDTQKKVIAYFKKAVELKASDIHLEIGKGGTTRIVMRIHGDLVKVDAISTKEGELLASTIVLSMCDVAEAQFNANRNQDGRVKAEFLRGLGLFGARYAHIPAVYGLYVVMRILPDDSATPPTLEALGFLPEHQRLLRRMLQRPEGIIILSGPTGSGKSTTLRTFSDLYLESTHQLRRLMTIEDPPEGEIEGAVQTAIIADKNNPAAVSQAWVRAISAALRLDPDALVVGEMRDENSAKTSITAAMTGHLLLTTLHANDPINILERLATLGINPALLTDPQLMIGLISQRLVQLLCPRCKKPWSAEKERLSQDDKDLLSNRCQLENLYFRHKDGCEHCHMGIVGRTVITEVISPDAKFMQTYRDHGKLAARTYWHRELNGITRNTHLLHHINAGLVDPLAADRVSPLDEDQWLLLDKEDK
ncbi:MULTISPECIES: GspE/PulE family protein [Yersinia]|uniref:PilQ protein n=2 Tax=Yersinia TaxID=629 RepID=B7UF87_YERPU|nr:MULTISPECIES: ATPase, T2SS/T4P/T4SS family [Yersinia]MBO1551367.1 type II secretion protein E [Yersinia pseudotuberculosis]MBO1562447.1 type II secretion protein E [Yersinia pseudotuberculosis]MBO1571420.1 type II secretion protein E [Yersinia pseudotuberculosis]MBO1586372.1 type II secretion protein E [Yersinia pseudotuberculosis]MBO1631802.1 Flp pilus assembly complex ATPase component TadA [Yersinia pseudotuberculosis]